MHFSRNVPNIRLEKMLLEWGFSSDIFVVRYKMYGDGDVNFFDLAEKSLAYLVSFDRGMLFYSNRKR